MAGPTSGLREDTKPGHRRVYWPINPSVETWAIGYQWMPEVEQSLRHGLQATMDRAGQIWLIRRHPQYGRH